MCRILNSILAVTVAGAVSGATLSARTGAPSIEGVWRTAEVTMTGPGARTITQLAPNLDIITAKHYSRVEVHAEGPRPIVADAAKATAEELRQAWGPVVAEAGTYETRGNTLTMRPVVAKNPAAMGAGASFTYNYRIVADTLWLTPQKDLRGAVVNPPTIKLTRVE